MKVMKQQFTVNKTVENLELIEKKNLNNFYFNCKNFYISILSCFSEWIKVVCVVKLNNNNNNNNNNNKNCKRKLSFSYVLVIFHSKLSSSTDHQLRKCNHVKNILLKINLWSYKSKSPVIKRNGIACNISKKIY